jgi:hypothetical protein
LLGGFGLLEPARGGGAAPPFFKCFFGFSKSSKIYKLKF